MSDKNPKKQKDKKDDKGAKEEGGDRTFSVIGDERATASIARLRSVGGLGSAAFVGLVTSSAGLPVFDAILRGLMAGILGYFVGWFVGVTVWRQLLRAELRAALVRRINASRGGEA
jgi:hypothetical protein